MIYRFGRPEICMIVNTLMDCIFENHSHRISRWNFDVLDRPLLQEYADVIHRKGAPSKIALVLQYTMATNAIMH